MRNCLPVIALAPAAAALSSLSCSQSTNEMAPFARDHRRALDSHFPLDVSFLLDAPAGRHGLIRVSNGGPATAGGERIRFWGAKITDWSQGSRQIPSKQDAPLRAAPLARFRREPGALAVCRSFSAAGLFAGGRQNEAAWTPSSWIGRISSFPNLRSAASISTSISWLAGLSGREMGSRMRTWCTWIRLHADHPVHPIAT